MNRTLRNLGPAAAVLAAITWLCWPAETSLDLQGEQFGQGLAQVKSAQLDPQLPPVSSRDPFRPVIDSSAPVQDAALAVAAEAGPEMPAPIDPYQVLAALELRGTFVSRKGKSAFIEDRLFFEGEVVLLENEPTIPCRLTRVLPDAVWLEIDGQPMLLEYADLATEQPFEDPAAVPAEGPAARRATSPPAGSGLSKLWQQVQNVVAVGLRPPQTGASAVGWPSGANATDAPQTKD